MLPIETPNPLFGLYLYPTAKEIMEQQQDIMWFAQEIKYVQSQNKAQKHQVDKHICEGCQG